MLILEKLKTRSFRLTGIYATLCAYQLCHKNKPTIQVSEILA
jgi:hypothetical protein